MTTGAAATYFVENNNFNGNTYGYLADRENNFRVTSNTFSGSVIGSVSFSAGAGFNSHLQNDFSGNIVGLHLFEDNQNYVFSDNCFGSASEDVNVEGLNTIVADQGEETFGAGNCFTENNIPAINAPDSEFDYYYPITDPDASSCLEPLGYTFVEDSDGVRDEDCGSTLPGGGMGTIPNCFEIDNLSCSELEDLRDELQTRLNNLLNSLNSSNLSNNGTVLALINDLYGCLQIVYFNITDICVGDDPFPSPVPRIPESDAAFARQIGELIEENKLSEAIDLLDYHPSSRSDELDDFINIQLINIRRIIEVGEFVLSTEEEEFINLVSSKSDPLAAYASGLQTLLTGEIKLPNIELSEDLQNRSRLTLPSETLSVYPNPVSGLLHINISAQETSLINSISLIGGIDNNVIELEPNMREIDVSQLSSGLYYLKVDFTNKKPQFHKVVVTR